MAEEVVPIGLKKKVGSSVGYGFQPEDYSTPLDEEKIQAALDNYREARRKLLDKVRAYPTKPHRFLVELEDLIYCKRMIDSHALIDLSSIFRDPLQNLDGYERLAEGQLKLIAEAFSYQEVKQHCENSRFLRLLFTSARSEEEEITDEEAYEAIRQGFSQLAAEHHLSDEPLERKDFISFKEKLGSQQVKGLYDAVVAFINFIWRVHRYQEANEKQRVDDSAESDEGQRFDQKLDKKQKVAIDNNGQILSKGVEGQGHVDGDESEKLENNFNQQSLASQLMAMLVTQRKAKKISAKDVAAAMGTFPANVSNWETGKTEPMIENIEKYAAAIGVSIVATPMEAQTEEPK